MNRVPAPPISVALYITCASNRAESETQRSLRLTNGNLIGRRLPEQFRRRRRRARGRPGGGRPKTDGPTQRRRPASDNDIAAVLSGIVCYCVDELLCLCS